MIGDEILAMWRYQICSCLLDYWEYLFLIPCNNQINTRWVYQGKSRLKNHYFPEYHDDDIEKYTN